jgi:hypothetical protein
MGEDDPNRSFALAPSCKRQSHKFVDIVTYDSGLQFR